MNGTWARRSAPIPGSASRPVPVSPWCTMNGQALTDYARAGSAVEAVWVIAQQCGLAVQPISPVFLYAHDDEDLEKLSPTHAARSAAAAGRFRELSATAPDESAGAGAQIRRCARHVGTESASGRCCQYALGITADPGANVARTLDEVVTAVATELMAVNAATSAAVSQRVLADLVGHFGVDVSFLRHNDHDIHATRLVAEWPVRPDIPDPDPLGRRVLRRRRPRLRAPPSTRKEILVFRPEPATDDYQRPSRKAATSPSTSMASCRCCPGTSRRAASGSSSSATGSGRPEELNALKAIASLFAQLQARVVAEDQLRYLAEHDDLTGLYNRRALLAHLDERLARGPARPRLGPVPRPRPAQGDQRLPRPHGGRLVHPGLRRTAPQGAPKAPT